MSGPKLANRFIFLFLIYEILLAMILKAFDLENIFLSTGLQILPIAFYFFLTRQNFLDVIYIKKISKKNLCLLILFAFMIQPVMAFFCGLANLFFDNPTQNIIDNLLSKPLYELIFFVAVCPALIEEIIFRGIIFSGYKNINIKKAFFFNGLLFAVIHLNYNQFVYALIMGVLFCIINFYTRSILASMLVHFIFNATQLLFMYLMLKKHIDFNSWLGNLLNLNLENNIFAFGLIAFVFGYICFLLLKKLINNCLSELNLDPKEKKINQDLKLKFDFGPDNKNDIINTGQEKIFTWPLIFYLALGFFLMTASA